MTTSLAGTPLPSAVLTVERGPVQVFADAVKDTHPAYASEQAAAEAGLPGIPVPPTFLFALGHWGTFAELQPPPPPQSRTLVELIAALRGDRKGVILHGSQEFEFHAPVSVGDVLHADGVVENVEAKPGAEGRPGMTVMIVRTDYRRESGEPAATARATFLFRPSGG